MQTFLGFAKIITRELFYKRSFAKINTREMQFFSTREKKKKKPAKISTLKVITG